MKQLLIAFCLFAVTAFGQEEKLLGVLKSDAPTKDKMDACRELARVATPQAVPVLASLLADESLSHMARYALEPIADPSVDAALRETLGKVKGRILTGIIGSLGSRKDTRAVEPLAQKLHDADPAVVEAAARALGSIGAEARPALEAALTTVTRNAQLAICEGLFRCAEAMRPSEAVAIYETIRKLPELPAQVRLAALKGTVRTRGPEGVVLMVDAIRGGALREAVSAVESVTGVSKEELTRVLGSELTQANEEMRSVLIRILGYRGDTTAVPFLAPWVKRGSARLRVTAIQSLVQLGQSTLVPTLVELAKDSEPAVASAAQAGLFAFPGGEADAAIQSLIQDRDAGLRVAASSAVAQRRLVLAIPDLLKAAVDADETVAAAGFKALGELASATEIVAMVDAALTTKAVAAAESALSALCARQASPESCLNGLLAGLAKAQGESKLALLRVLGAIGSQEALSALRVAAADPDASVKETAIRVLCDWPSVDALPDLARIAAAAQAPNLRILALRGQLRLIPLQSVTDAKKVSDVRALVPMLERAEEKRLALAVLTDVPTSESLELATSYLNSSGVSEEASVAAVTIAERLVARQPIKVADALERLTTNNPSLTERVRKLRTRLAESAEAGFTAIFNGRDLTGWHGKPGWWTVEDGALTSESTPDKPCRECNYLIWRGGRPGDFELRAEFKLSRSANSGIQIRSEERANWDTSGYQADMTGDGELIGFVYHHQRGLIAGRGEKALFDSEGRKTGARFGDAADLLKSFKPEDWNTYRVVCEGPEITLFINGVRMCQVEDHHASQAAARGIIALQMHPGPPMKVQFRNIRLREF